MAGGPWADLSRVLRHCSTPPPHTPPGWPSSVHFSGFDHEWHSWRFLAHGRPNLRMSGTRNQPDLPAHSRQLNRGTRQKYRQVDRQAGTRGARTRHWSMTVKGSRAQAKPIVTKMNPI